VPDHQVSNECRGPTGREDAHDGAVDDNAFHGPIVGPEGSLAVVGLRRARDDLAWLRGPGGRGAPAGRDEAGRLVLSQV
jgi:hypothetical protein